MALDFVVMEREDNYIWQGNTDGYSKRHKDWAARWRQRNTSSNQAGAKIASSKVSVPVLGLPVTIFTVYFVFARDTKAEKYKPESNAP